MFLKLYFLNSKFQGEDILLPQIPMITLESPIQFKRLQFLICLIFALLICYMTKQCQVCIKSRKSVLLTWPIICCVFSCWLTIKFDHLYTTVIDQKHCSTNNIRIKTKQVLYLLMLKFNIHTWLL